MQEQNDIPITVFPVTSYSEIRKDFIRTEGNTHPDGWDEYYGKYKSSIRHYLTGRAAGPFKDILVFPYTLEMHWVGALLLQDTHFKSDKWAEMKYRCIHCTYSNTLEFHILLMSDLLSRLSKEYLRFVYQDSTGDCRDIDIKHYELDDDFHHIFRPDEPIYRVEVGVDVPLGDNPEDISWFSLRIINTNAEGVANMRWEFARD